VTVRGGGEFVSAENGDESDFSWFRDPKRSTFNGYLSILVRRRPNSGEAVIVEASGAGISGNCSF